MALRRIYSPNLILLAKWHSHRGGFKIAARDDDTQKIEALEQRVDDLEADIGNLMQILRGDVIEGIAVALDDIQALLGILPRHVLSLADELQPIHDMNESARSALRSSEVFEWKSPSKEELSKK